jgi:hypothetical protein
MRGAIAFAEDSQFRPFSNCHFLGTFALFPIFPVARF